jgi:hypothetical protein
MADNKIQKALHSNGEQGTGLTAAGDLVNRKRFVSHAPGKVVRLFDDFLGDVIADQWAVVEGTDSTTSDAAVVSGIGGTLVLTTGDSATVTYAGNGIQVTQGAFYNWKAANGGLRLEARIKIDDISTAAFFVGFTDLGTFEAPIESAGSANTLTSNASDAVGFMFDTRMTDDNIWLVGVKGNTDATHQDSGIAPVADTYITLALEVDTAENAIFYINGNRVGTVMASAVTETVALTPTIAATSLVDTESRVVTVDYIDVEMHRV